MMTESKNLNRGMGVRAICIIPTKTSKTQKYVFSHNFSSLVILSALKHSKTEKIKMHRQLSLASQELLAI